MKFAHVSLVSSIGMLTLGAVTSLQAATIVPAFVSQTGGYTGGTANDGSENSAQTAPAGAAVIYSLGAAPVTFRDISITATNVNTKKTPNNFHIEVQATDDPNATTGWTTIATASNIFGYSATSGTANSAGNTWNAGRRIEFAPVTKQYFRYVNDDTATDTFQEIQVGRPVLLTATSSGPTSTARAMNLAADGISGNIPGTSPAQGSTFRSAGTSGSFNFDALSPTGEGVKTITLQHADVSSSGSSFSFPTGTVTVLDSNDPTFATFNSTNFTLNSDETAGAIYSLTYANAVNSRYFQFQWSNVVTPTATSTQFAEVGITTAAVPEPVALSLMGAAGLMLLRRRRAR